MKCPVCNSLMIVVEHEKIELDYCLNCSGVWFDAEEVIREEAKVSHLQSENEEDNHRPANNHRCLQARTRAVV